MFEYKFYIGSHNVTGELNIEHIVKMFKEKVTGFTITRSVGYWMETRELSVVVTVLRETEFVLLKDFIKRLQSELEQDEILVTKNEVEII